MVTELIEKPKEMVLLVGLNCLSAKKKLQIESSIKELAMLTENAGGVVIEEIIVNRDAPHPTHYLGKGKIDELNIIIDEKNIDLVVIDAEITVRQQLQLDERLNCRVIDRTALILQIFADRARTKEGKLQIELAQLSYLMPRLTGKGKDMSRLGAGIGTRGPGESQLEKDRRHIRQRIDNLKLDIEGIRKQRMVTRSQREKREIPILTLVGYTNSGKSTLLNILTQSQELSEDKLFATLDPTTRRLNLQETEALLTDTVGFIQQLPHSLVTAFRATLEEATFSDLLIHVIDASHPDVENQIRTVQKVLKEIGCQDKPIIFVFNKIDLITDIVTLESFVKQFEPFVLISAKNGEGLDRLKKLLVNHLPKPLVTINFKIPVSHGQILNQLYQAGSVLDVEYGATEITGRAILPEKMLQGLEQYIEGSLLIRG